MSNPDLGIATLVERATTSENVSDPDMGIATLVEQATTSENHGIRVRGRAHNCFLVVLGQHHYHHQNQQVQLLQTNHLVDQYVGVVMVFKSGDIQHFNTAISHLLS